MSESELLEMVDEGRCVVFSDVADVDGEPLVFRSSDVINEVHEASLAIMEEIPASEYIYFLKNEYERLVDDGILSDDAKNVFQMFNKVDSFSGIEDIILEKILGRFEKDITEEVPNKFYASVNGENASDYAFDNSPSGGASEMRDYVNVFRMKVEEKSHSRLG